jgi:acetylornithine deacetylase/succinyl-diaminopimelate desuccinylase-like protein
MVDENESITVDGFYENVSEPSSEDEELLANLDGVFDETMILEENDVARFKYDGLHGTDLLRRYLFSPMINIDGLLAGYTGPGVKTVMGHQAIAKLDIRLIPHMTVEGTLSKVRDHLVRQGFEDVRVEVLGGYEWSRTSVKEEVVQAVHQSYRYHGYSPEIWPYLGGSAPSYLFTKKLGLPLVMGGLCHGGGAHSPNEYAVLDQIEIYEKSIATFLFQYAFGAVASEHPGSGR